MVVPLGFRRTSEEGRSDITFGHPCATWPCQAHLSTTTDLLPVFHDERAAHVVDTVFVLRLNWKGLHRHQQKSVYTVTEPVQA